MFSSGYSEQPASLIYRELVPPTFEPVTLAQAKLWCKVEDDQTEEEAVLLMLIKAMREYAENLTGRHFVERTMEMALPYFPPSVCPIELPFPPCQGLQYITYIDTDGVQQRIEGSPTQWQEDYISEPARIVPLYMEAWPQTRRVLNAVRLVYVSGYSSMDAIPKSLKLWMNARLLSLFDQRSQIITGTIVNELPRVFVDGLLDSLVVGRRLF
jgi:uncharacterized phiE125 gp8 family phage protein